MLRSLSNLEPRFKQKAKRERIIKDASESQRRRADGSKSFLSQMFRI